MGSNPAAGTTPQVDGTNGCQISDGHVDVRLTLPEKVFALRGDYRFARSHIEAIEVLEDGLRATQGLRAPGLGIPGLRRVGTWRGRRGKQLVSVRRNQSALRIVLAEERYQAVVIGVDDPEPLRAALTG